MIRGPTGTSRVTQTFGEQIRAFIPNALPPEPPLDIGGELREMLDEALLALGRLDSISTLLPDTSLFLYMYIRKEAVLSSQIEGTQSSLSDLLLFEIEEAPGVPFDDVVEVSNYVAAMQHGLSRVREGFPISNRLLREMHALLLSRGRGASKEPGEFRHSQNWLGGTRPGTAAFVPPPVDALQDCMGALELFLHDQPTRTPTLIKAALAHVQFETIHPFLDGNGRLGRLLITLLLCVEGTLHEPLLYLSLYLKQNRSEYYRLLDQVRKDGDWEAWLHFFAKGVRVTASAAVVTAQQIVALFAEDRARIQNIAGRNKGTLLRIHQAFEQRPVTDMASLAKATGISFPTVSKSLETLGSAGLVKEITGRRRNRVYSYAKYLALLSEGTEPLG